MDEDLRTMTLPDDLDALENTHIASMLAGFVNGYLLDRRCAGRLLVHARGFYRDLPTCTEMVVPENGHVTIVGDTHGQIQDLFWIFDVVRHKQELRDRSRILEEDLAALVNCRGC